jgi:hypothetical protein
MFASIFKQGVLEANKAYALVDKPYFLGLRQVRIQMKHSGFGIRSYLDMFDCALVTAKFFPVLFS